MSRHALIASLTLLLASPPPPTRAAAVGPECSASQEVDRYQLLRRLSLSLRGHLPSYEEYLALDAEPDVPEALIDDMLASDAFRLVMRRFHADLLWPNLTGTQITDVAHVLDTVRIDGQPQSPETARWAIVGNARRRTWRGGTGTAICGDWLQTDFNADGTPVTRTVTPADGDPYEQDGYVLVPPYWAPDTAIRVCAFEAQSAPSAALPNGQSVACDSARGLAAKGCGCGPDLRWCYGNRADRTVLAALVEQLARLVDEHTVGGRPYSELLTTRATWTNGTLAFWKQHLAHQAGLNRTFNARSAVDEPIVPDPDFTDTTWVRAERAAPHSGLLTLPGYTLRFQTNRARANRFRTVFTHQSFIPPATTTDTDCDETAADLTQRCLCRHCHQVLEPLAAHFGGIAEAGSAVIAGSPDFPIYQPACDPTRPENAGRKLTRTCERFYVVDPEAHAPGTLVAHQYADIDDAVHRQIADALAAGPEGLARSAIDLGLFHGAVTRHLFATLMGREMILDPGDKDSELSLLEELTTELRGHDDLRAQVKRLVMLPQFRRVR